VADVQKYFRQFDEAIRFERDDEKAILAEKRQRVLKRLSEGIARQRKEGAEIPGYEPFNQGSYAMNTGVKPIDGDFDLDVGLRFDLAAKDYHDPVVVKTWVLNALENHTKTVEMSRSCIRVYYKEGGEDVYHLDLVCYSSGKKNEDGKDYLARGKPESSAKDRCWVASDPQRLQELIVGKHSDVEDDQQFRRAVRALKRWKDLKLSTHGRAAPKGIALTVAAYRWFEVSKQPAAYGKPVKYDDLEALRHLVAAMVGRFQTSWNEAERRSGARLAVALPYPPGSDLCENMSAASMTAFKERLEDLLAALKKAKEAVEAHDACAALRAHFGDDFPVPEKNNR
jgi:hypothetical protein